jgi:DHA1 family multidrug resistance protein-like MFS transporter
LPRFQSLAPWQRNQYAVVSAVGLAFASFELTQSFVPLYIRELGEAENASFWAGLVAGVAPLGASIMGPVWGNMADRYGRKPMVLRALIFISFMQFACAFVPNVQWLLGVRILMGVFAGFTSMAMALAIAVTPREKMAHAIGLVQAAQIAPASIGPLIGGVLTDTIGFRSTFMVTGILLVIPSLMLGFLVNESFDKDAAQQSAGKGKGAGGSFRALFFIPGFAAALAILFVARFTERALPPILPLYLIELQTPTAMLATITGVVVASGALAATVSSIAYGRRARPDNTRRLLITALIGGAICSVLISFAGDWIQVTGLRIVLGLLAGGTMSLAYTMGARLAPGERSALTLSVLASCGMLGGAVSPILAGTLGQVLSLRSVFLTVAAAYLLAVGLAVLPAVRRAEQQVEAEAVAEA